MQRRFLVYLAMMIAVPIAGELKSFPIQETVRVSLGTPVFFFFLLWSRQINSVVSGFLVGISVVAFRVLLGVYVGDMDFVDAFDTYFPVFFYYLVFAAMFHFLKVKQRIDQPLYIGLLGVFMEIVSTITEIGVRSIYTQMPMTIHSFLLISIIAIIRSFFVLGFFNLLVIREARLAEDAQRHRNEQMLVLISNLFVEMVQLNKTMKNTEQLTSIGYGLYRDLKESGNDVFAQTALKIAGEIHEIKKDNQRIYAGLSKMMAKEKLNDFMPISEIIHVVVTGNKRYAAHLNKNIEFNINIIGIHPAYNTFLLLSVVNNLVSNAVEAIDTKGEIDIEAQMDLDMLEVRVKDNGSGISPRNRPLIFTPGFTTKFDQIGNASNGIGLSYVKDMIEGLGGSIRLEELESCNKTVFTICLPIKKLTERG
ncbi:sensor histidine kinase [Neobacillus sp. LXY-4]|uniref:sensor histidine kinase n=1 Tax=Neobacillus sp. LXY-4 TaxID=3379826 RepID=UPI003EE1E730